MTPRPFLLTLLLAALFAGCSDPPPEPPKPADDTPAAIPSSKQGNAKARPSDPVAIVRPQIPPDLFFEDPLAVANNTTRVDGSAAPESEAVAAVTTDQAAEPEPAPPETAAAVDWAILLPAELLTAEVTRIRERFEPKLASVATFNNSLLDFPPYMAELAALGGIAAAHQSPIPWKDKAKHVRDLAAATTEEQLQRGQKSYVQVKGPFEKVAAILDGKRPADLPEADDETDFAVAADFGYLMRRFEAGQNTIQTTGGSASAFKQNAADLAREARILAALSRVVADADYGYGDDPKFQRFAADMTHAALEAATAAESGDHAKFDLAFNALGQSCNACHGEYRNN